MSNSDKMTAILVAGARPNFMKVAPVLWALEDHGVDVQLVHSGQHYDSAMSDVFFDELGIRPPDVNLGVGSGSQAGQTASIMVAFEPIVERVRPDVVIVVGDVNSTVACALVAAKAGARVAHVEAGLRSRDWAMPEEINRVVTDRLSDHLFAPSADACDNLRSEGYRDDQISLVGNVMVDTLLGNLDRALARPTLEQLGVEAGQYGLVTLHRPSNVDDPVTFARLLGALGQVAARVPLIFPVHPRTRKLLEATSIPTGIRLVEPSGYLDFIALQASAAVVLTDSGGVQEETTVLGTPCITLRDNTERPITVTQGTNTVVGTDPRRIVDAVDAALDHPVEPVRPELWDGKAGIRIAEVLTSPTAYDPGRRPTSLPDRRSAS
jgi:UDP-N-acetylglucosamine 2-epimerase (non-hydrolysing)